MRIIIRSVIIAASFIAGGAAFAGQTAESDFADQQAASRLQFVAQSAVRAVRDRANDRRQAPFQSATTPRGSNR
jgi:hypothetical protein